MNSLTRRYVRRVMKDALEDPRPGAPTPVASVSPLPVLARHVDDADLGELYEVSITPQMEDFIWDQIEELLDSLAKKHPSKVHFVRGDIRWLRHQAWLARLPWGKDKHE